MWSYWEVRFLYLLLKQTLSVQPKLALNSQTFLLDFPCPEVLGENHSVQLRYRVFMAHITCVGVCRNWVREICRTCFRDRVYFLMHLLVNCLPGFLTISPSVWVKKIGSIKQADCMSVFSTHPPPPSWLWCGQLLEFLPWLARNKWQSPGTVYIK